MYAGKVQQDMLRQRPQAVVSAQEPAKPIVDTARAAAVDNAPEAAHEPTFEELIEGKFKADFDKRVQGIVQGRLRTAKGAEERLNQFAPAILIMAERYGLDFSDLAKADPAALAKAIEDDDALYEEYAMREGITTDQAKKQMRMEREVAQARAFRAAQENEQQMRDHYARLQAQSEEFRKAVPTFDLRTELQNETFGRAIVNGFDVKSAYYAAHADEIDAMHAAQTNAQLRQTAEAATAAAAKAVASGARRPAENGTSGAAAASAPKIDISKLTAKDFRELATRAARGDALPSSLFQG
jgi:hypothetical protein